MFLEPEQLLAEQPCFCGLYGFFMLLEFEEARREESGFEASFKYFQVTKEGTP